jgi:hypothetical protein
LDHPEEFYSDADAPEESKGEETICEPPQKRRRLK